jgi:nucleoid-associated protein YgaU
MSIRRTKAVLASMVVLLAWSPAAGDSLTLWSIQPATATEIGAVPKERHAAKTYRPYAKARTRKDREVHLYNSRVQAKFDDGPILKCDGQDEPDDYMLPLEPSEEPVLDSDWGLRLTAINLKYVAGTVPGTFNIERTLFLEADSEQLQRTKVIGGAEKHGCDEELYSVGSQFSSSNEEIDFTSRVFAAKRVCVNRYFGGRAAVCSAESTLSGVAYFKVQFSQTYEECIKGRNSAAMEIATIRQDNPAGGQTAQCAGVRVDNVPILTGLLGGIGLGFITKLILDNNTHMPGVSVPPLPLHQVNRPPNDSVTVCPLRINTRNLSPTRVQIGTTEGMKNMVGGLACGLYHNHRRELMKYAETLAPTKAVTIENGDTYWELARRLWGDGRLYPLLENSNGWKTMLNAGNQIPIPRLDQILSDPSTVRQGDTLWDAAIRLKGSPSGFISLHKGVKPSTQDPNRIYPFSLIEPVKP